MKKFKTPSVDETINLSLTNILNNLKYLNSVSKGVRVAYYGNFKELKKDCMRIVNALERLEGNHE